MELNDVQDKKLEQTLFKEVFAIQDENIKIAIDLVKKADDAIEIGMSINTNLHVQTQKLATISKELDNLKGTIKRAGAEIGSFMRGLASDKLILVLLIVVILVIVILLMMWIVCKAGVCKLICKGITDGRQDGRNPCPGFIM